MLDAKMTAGRYYLAIIIMAIFAIIPYLAKLKIKKQKTILITILIIQIIFNFSQYCQIAGPAYDATTIKNRTENNQLIIATLKNKITTNTHILVSPLAAFNYHALKINYSQIHTLFGPLSDWMLNKKEYEKRYSAQGDLNIKIFYPKDFIILEKPKTLEAQIDANLAQLFSGQLGYQLIAENKNIWIFQKEQSL